MNGSSRETDAIRVLVAEDDAEMLQLIRRVLGEEGYQVLCARDGYEAMAILEQGEFDLVLTDIRMPGPDGMAVLRRAMARRLAQPVILMTAFGSISSAVEAMREGAYHYLAKPFNLDELLEVIGSTAEVVRQLRSIRGLQPAEHDLVFPIVCRSQAMTELLAMAQSVAESTATVLIHGESGTGKELLAHAIHSMSPRRDGPFVALDASGIPENLLESELFGHRRGSFTGAVSDKPGIIEQADGGTLFLDEVSNLSLPVQARMLRFLQERCYRRVGEVSERSLDLRLVSASNQDLREQVTRGELREDLYYRLSVITLRIPALRERREDIPLLVYHFIRKLNAASSYRVDGIRREAMDRLFDYPWPGNVRQLANVIERAVILRKAGLIQPADLPEEIAGTGHDAGAGGRSLEELEREHILSLLQGCDGNQSRVARILGISRRTVYRKLKSWGLQ